MFIAITDHEDREHSYYGYSRQRLDPSTLDWVRYDFAKLPEPGVMKIGRIYVCDGETSSLEDAIDLGWIGAIVQANQTPSVYVNMRSIYG